MGQKEGSDENNGDGFEAAHLTALRGRTVTGFPVWFPVNQHLLRPVPNVRKFLLHSDHSLSPAKETQTFITSPV